MAQIAAPETEPWQESDPGPDRGIGQDGRVYVWFEPRGWEPAPEPEMEAG